MNQSKMLNSYIKYLDENSASAKKPCPSGSKLANEVSKSMTIIGHHTSEDSDLLRIESIEKNGGSRMSIDHMKLIEISRRIIRNR